MKNLFTDYFTQLKKCVNRYLVPVSVCGKAPSWYKKLEYKNNKINEEEYTKGNNMPSFPHILPLRGKTESILKIEKPDIGMLILSTDEYKLYAYLNETIEWKSLSQSILAFEYFSWGFATGLWNGRNAMYLRSQMLNPNNYGSLKFKYGNHESHSKYVGAQYEITYDTDLCQLYVHDGITPGGLLL